MTLYLLIPTILTLLYIVCAYFVNRKPSKTSESNNWQSFGLGLLVDGFERLITIAITIILILATWLLYFAVLYFTN